MHCMRLYVVNLLDAHLSACLLVVCPHADRRTHRQAVRLYKIEIPIH